MAALPTEAEGETARTVVKLLEPAYDRVFFHAGRNPHALSGALVDTDSVNSEKVFAATKAASFWSQEFIAVNELKTYKLSVDYRVLAPESVGYFSIKCFDDDFQEITAFDVLRYGNAAIVTAVSDDFKTITCDRALERWHGKGQQCHSRSLGFYVDGFETRKVRPDFYVKPYTDWRKTDESEGGYSHTSECNIHLTDKGAAELRLMEAWKIEANVTVVRNHFSSSTYLYPMHSAMTAHFAKGTGDEWKQLEIGGIHSFAGIDHSKEYKEIPTVLRPGTKYVKLGYSHTKGRLNFNHLIFALE